MKIIKSIIISIASVAGCLAMTAQDGSTAYNFLNVPSSSLIYGLGGVNITAVGEDISLIEQNPGLLGSEMDNQVAIDYMRYLGDSNFAGVRYGHSAGDHGAWSAAIRYFGYGTIKGMDEMGNPIGDFSPKDLSFSASYSHDITARWRGGATVKMLYSSYEQYTAFALATDLGVNYYDMDRDLSFSVVVANLGGQVKRFNERYDRLPVDLRIGWAKSFGSVPVRFSVTAWNLTKWHLPYYETGDGSDGSVPKLKESFGSNFFRHLIFGAQYVGSDKFYLALGYNYKVRTDMSTYSRSFLSGFSIGAGLNVNKFGVGIAFAQPHSGATTFMVNLRIDINDFL